MHLRPEIFCDSKSGYFRERCTTLPMLGNPSRCRLGRTTLPRVTVLRDGGLMVTTAPFDSSQSTSAPGRAGRLGHRRLGLIVAEVLLAVGAFGGAVGLIVGGIDLGKATDDLPFGSPVLGGVALAVSCGVLPTVVAVGAWRRAPWAPLGHVAVGVVLVGWVVVQIAFIGLGSWLQVGYAVFGLGIAALGISNLHASRRPGGTSQPAGGAVRRRRVRLLQRWVLNPPMKAATWLGLVPDHVLIEPTGRVSGRRRRNVVGIHFDGEVGWIVAEQGRHAGYVRNLEADSQVRVHLRRRWRAGSAAIVDDDDPQVRLDMFAMDRHAAAVRRFGTDLLTVRVDLARVDDRRRRPGW